MSSLRYDSEYLEALKPFLPNQDSDDEPAPDDFKARRAGWEKVQEKRYCNLPDIAGVDVTVYQVPTTGDSEFVSVYRICPTHLVSESSSPSSAIIHTHSGGMILGSVPFLLKRLKFQASDCNVQIFSVDYHLAPETPHPGPVTDCYSTLTWLLANAEELHVDPSRIATMGESAGGNLATAVALMARDNGLKPPLAKQILIYPMLDDRTINPNPELEKFTIWNHEENLFAWAAYLGAPNKVGAEDTDPYAAPARATDLRGLPSTYVEVGGLDLFRDEGIQYASRIAQNNIDCELHVYPGVTHSFEAIGPKVAVSRRAWQNLRAAMTSF